MSVSQNSLLRNLEELSDVRVKGVEHLWYLVTARATRILMGKLGKRELVCDALMQFEFRIVKYFDRIMAAPESKGVDELDLVNKRLQLALRSSWVEALRYANSDAAVSTVAEDGADWASDIPDALAGAAFEECLYEDRNDVRQTQQVLDTVGVRLWENLSHPHRRVLQAAWTQPRKPKEKTRPYMERLAALLAKEEGQRPMGAGRVEVYLSEIRSALKLKLKEAGADEQLLAAQWSEVSEELLAALRKRPEVARAVEDWSQPTHCQRQQLGRSVLAAP